jgi:hypothetical protein
MATPLHLAKIAEGMFTATRGSNPPERWGRHKLHMFLVTHGYAVEEARAIVDEAERSDEIDIHIPDPLMT